MVRVTLCGLTSAEIFDYIGPLGYTVNHANIIANSIYKKRIRSVSSIPKIPKKLIKILENDSISGIFEPVSSEVSKDKSTKYMFRTDSGMEFETVFMPDGKRNTVCVSTQSGCRMGCSFCVTGRYGFHGNLSAGEIVNQVLSIPEAYNITHVVFMGMGEPMDNLENVLKACEILSADWGAAISHRNITVSTAGITSSVKKFLTSSDCNLTLSLHSPFPEERKAVVPVESKYPALDIIGIMKAFPVKKTRRFSLAYVMIKDVNDTVRHLETLRDLVIGSKIRINLLSYHRVPGDTNYSSSDERMQFFKHNLIISGVSASIRKSRGADISAACGLLASGLKK